MLRKIGFGFLWFVGLYFGACMVIGAVAGGAAGGTDPQHAYEAGKVAGAQAVTPLIPYIFTGSLLVAAVGSALGVLPGTRKKVAPTPPDGSK